MTTNNVPTDEEILQTFARVVHAEPDTRFVVVDSGNVIDFARALLSRYGQPAMPADAELLALVKECPDSLGCDAFHHPLPDQHGDTQDCPPAKRYQKALDAARLRIEGES